MKAKVKAGTMDWLKLEAGLRQILKAALHTRVDAEAGHDFALLIAKMDDLIGNETGRGYELPEGWADQFNKLKVDA